MHRLNLNECQASYGAYDCLLNSVEHWLVTHKVSTKRLHQFNWSFYVTENELFGGSINKLELIRFLQEHMGLHVKEVQFEQMPENDRFLMALDAYYLPYIQEVFLKHHQIHYVSARKTSCECVELYDPYYKTSLPWSWKECMEAWLPYSKQLLLLSLENSPSQAKRKTAPYLSTKAFVQVYDEALKRLRQMLSQLAADSTRDRAGVEFRYNRYFALFRSITLARSVCLEALNDSTFQANSVRQAWSGVERSLIRMKLQPERGLPFVFQSLEDACQKDRAYLTLWNQVDKT